MTKGRNLQQLKDALRRYITRRVNSKLKRWASTQGLTQEFTIDEDYTMKMKIPLFSDHDYEVDIFFGTSYKIATADIIYTDLGWDIDFKFTIDDSEIPRVCYQSYSHIPETVEELTR